MSTANPPDIDWSITTFEDAQREQLRRWAELPLIEILKALEEMETLAQRLGANNSAGRAHAIGQRPKPLQSGRTNRPDTQIMECSGTAFCSCACSVQAYGKSALHRGTPWATML